MTAPRISDRRSRVVDAALWSSSVGLSLLTVLFSIGLSPPGTGDIPMADKIGHGFLYFLSLSGFLLAAVWRPGRGNGLVPRGALALTIGAVLAGIALEVLQEVGTTDRHAQVGDALAEGVGALGAFALHGWMRRHGSRSDPSRQP